MRRLVLCMLVTITLFLLAVPPALADSVGPGK